MSSTGRNDPCTCGSGRKFKHCCLRALDADDAARIRLRTAEGVLVPALFAYAAEEFGDEFVDEAWEEFFVGAAAPDDIDNSREFGTTFDPFFVFSFVPDAENDRPVGRSSRSRCTSYTRRSSPAPTSTASSSSRRARATRASSLSNRRRLADRSISRTS